MCKCVGVCGARYIPKQVLRALHHFWIRLQKVLRDKYQSENHKYFFKLGGGGGKTSFSDFTDELPHGEGQLFEILDIMPQLLIDLP